MEDYQCMRTNKKTHWNIILHKILQAPVEKSYSAIYASQNIFILYQRGLVFVLLSSNKYSSSLHSSKHFSFISVKPVIVVTLWDPIEWLLWSGNLVKAVAAIKR